jgi:sphingolipid 4-desaturase/C4-monooxygenase
MTYWAEHAQHLKHELAAELSAEDLRRLHAKRPWLHALVAFGNFAALVLSGAAIVHFDRWYLWLPFAFVAGFAVFDCTVLLHEVVHRAVLTKSDERIYRILGLLYAVPSGISASQFTRWHLDHHAELGSYEMDPKRHYLSPKINARWLKLLYFTPALFPIYFRAARRETASYPKTLQNRIAWERWGTILFHVAVMAALYLAGGFGVLARVYLVPTFLVFPIAFALNRLGQHYAIGPEDPAKWGTVLKPSRWWDFWYLHSAYHLEHHYFTAVPFYNLRRLHFALRPFFDSIGWKPTTYGRLFRAWIFDNKAPHTDWHLAG